MCLAVELFERLVVVGNALESFRDRYEPCSDTWLWSTEILGLLDAAIDRLVRSSGLNEEDDDA